MKFLKFCIDTDFVDKHISDDMDVKDIRFIKAKINSTQMMKSDVRIPKIVTK